MITWDFGNGRTKKPLLGHSKRIRRTYHLMMKQIALLVAYPIPKQKHSQQRGKRLDKTLQGDSYMIIDQANARTLGGGGDVVPRVALRVIAVCDKVWGCMRRRRQWGHGIAHRPWQRARMQSRCRELKLRISCSKEMPRCRQTLECDSNSCWSVSPFGRSAAGLPVSRWLPTSMADTPQVRVTPTTGLSSSVPPGIGSTTGYVVVVRNYLLMDQRPSAHGKCPRNVIIRHCYVSVWFKHSYLGIAR